MKTKMLFIAFTAALLNLSAADPKEGVVNFANCVTESKLGKQEQASYEATRKQLYSLLEDTDKQIKDLNAKLEDKDTLEGLTPEAIQAIKDKIPQLTEEFYQYNQQYNHFLSKGQYQAIQTVMAGAVVAAEKVATSKGYTKIASKEAYLYHSPSLDITTDVVKEMDKTFDEEAKKQAAAQVEAMPDAKDTSSTR